MLEKIVGREENKMSNGIGVYIGRFQPLHIGHVDVIEQALKTYDKLIVLIGSTNYGPTLRNPFSYEERLDQFKLVFVNQIQKGNLVIAPVRDYLYSETSWLERIVTTVESLIDPRLQNNICIVGYEKDSSSYYLNNFKKWGAYFNVESNFPTISATDIRNELLSGQLSAKISDQLPEKSRNFVCDKLINSPSFHELKIEYQVIQEYKDSWKSAPYPPIFATVDAFVQYKNSVLLVRRKDHPGKDRWALPGGFINQNETLMDAAKRECLEETGIDLGEIDSKVSFVCDSPYRSSRGRVITTVFYFNVSSFDASTIRAIKAGDDARAALFVDFADLPFASQFHDDHFQIIEAIMHRSNQLHKLRNI